MKNLTHTALAVIVLAMNCHPVFATQPEQQTMQTQPEFKNAQDFIEFFRRGEEWYDRRSVSVLIVDNQPDPNAMKALGEELMVGTQDVRSNIIRLLDTVRQFSHPGRELRTPEVIALLVGPGFAKTDGARSDAMMMLCKYASPVTLSRYGDVFLGELKKKPNYGALCLIAKAKTKAARKEIKRLSRLPEWNNPSDSDREAMRIARAALGDTKIENEFIAEATRLEAEAMRTEGKGDLGSLKDVLNSLVKIGTPRSLRFVCQRMRSPLINDQVGVSQTSLRLSVMNILQYAFPGEPSLGASVYSDEDYIRVEQFCVRELGEIYRGIPRPEYFHTILYLNEG